jgi:hypothetical protein
MFRRLAQLEGYQSGAGAGSGADVLQTNYNQNQAYRYNTLLPNIIPTDSSYPAPKGLEQAFRGVDVRGGVGVPLDPVADVGRLFQPAGVLASQSSACESASLDQLIASRDPKNPVGCAWIYTPPTTGSPIPQLGKGVLGTAQGPVTTDSLPAYKQYYWDLAQAKKQMLLDKCKALKTCSDTGAPIFGADCGYCTDLGQGVPIDANGNPLYTDSPLSYCSPASLITPGNTATCPAPPPPGSTPGPVRPQAPCTADSNGRLSTICLESLLVQGGCSDKGSFYQALSSGATPSDYMATARNLPSLQLYNKTANPPLNLTTLSQGQLATAAALQEFQQVAANTRQPPTSALGAAARDLCLQAGAINSYNFCQDVPLSTPPPFDSNLKCLQSYFLQAGGTPSGRMYPSTTNLAYYNTNFKTLGDVINYFKGLKAQSMGSIGQEGFTMQRMFASATTLGSSLQNPLQKRKEKEAFVDADPYAEASAVTRSYVSQATALLDLQGIMPDQLSGRPPHTAGVECLWIYASGAWPNWKVVGYTVEQSFPVPIRYNANTLVVLTDLRLVQDLPAQIQVQTGTGIIALNQGFGGLSSSIDENGMLTIPTQQSNPYTSKTCWSLSGSKPNVILAYNQTLNPAGFALQVVPCSTTPSTTPSASPNRGFSMAREYGAPFITMERRNGSAWMGDPQWNGYFVTMYGSCPASGLVFPSIADAALKAPGTNGYTTFPPRAYMMNPMVSPAAWQAITFAFRLTSLPVLDTFLTVTSGGAYMQLNLKNGGSSANVLVSNNIPTIAAANAPTQINLNVNQWYLGIISQQRTASGPTAWAVNFVDLQAATQAEYQVQYANTASSVVLRTTNGSVFDSNMAPNGLVAFGNNAGNIAPTSANTLSFDLAWLHYFSPNIPYSQRTLRDARNDWQILSI